MYLDLEESVQYKMVSSTKTTRAHFNGLQCFPSLVDMVTFIPPQECALHLLKARALVLPSSILLDLSDRHSLVPNHVLIHQAKTHYNILQCLPNLTSYCHPHSTYEICMDLPKAQALIISSSIPLDSSFRDSQPPTASFILVWGLNFLVGGSCNALNCFPSFFDMVT